jgi:hypothetical protein
MHIPSLLTEILPFVKSESKEFCNASLYRGSGPEPPRMAEIMEHRKHFQDDMVVAKVTFTHRNLKNPLDKILEAFLEDRHYRVFPRQVLDFFPFLLFCWAMYGNLNFMLLVPAPQLVILL